MIQINLVADALAEHGWVCRPEFVPETTWRALAAEVRARHAGGSLRAAGVGSHERRRTEPAVRGDQIRWLEPTSASVAQQDALVYDEPPAWYYPLRESLGAALVRAGRAADAEKVFREDLDHTPRNGRSLFGLWQSLEMQGRKADAASVKTEFEKAWKRSQIPLRIEDL